MLTVDDITMIQEALRPQFERIEMRFEGIDARFEQIDKRFERVDAQFAQIEARFDERFGQVEERLDGFGDRFEQSDARFDRVDQQLAVHGDSFRVILRRLDKQDRDLEDFAATVVTSFASLEDRLDAIGDNVAVIKDIVKDHGFRIVRLEGRHGRRS